MISRELHSASNRRSNRGRAHVIGLLAALSAGLLVNGCCAIWLVQDRGLAAAGLYALGVVLLPMSLALAWWMVMTLASDRRANSGLTPNYALLVLAMALGVAAVWLGSSYVRIMRLTIGQPATVHKAPAPSTRTTLSTSTYCRLAGAGALLQLALVTIGRALRRDPIRNDVSPRSANTPPPIGPDGPAA